MKNVQNCTVHFVNIAIRYRTEERREMFNYDPYRELLERRNIKQQELINDNTINTRIANYLKHNESVTVNTLEKLCKRLNCQFNDLVKHVDDLEESEGV